MIQTKLTIFIAMLHLTGLVFGADSESKTRQTKETEQHRCHTCQSTESLKYCSGCRDVHYCSKACQTKDWKTHQTHCRKVAYQGRLKEAAASDHLIKRINPKYGQNGFNHNCDFCANLFCILLKTGKMTGYNEGAIAFDPLWSFFSEQKKQHYLQQNLALTSSLGILKSRKTAKTIQEIEETLRIQGEFSLCIVHGYRSFSPGKAMKHSWVSFLVDGVIYHKCPQAATDLPFSFEEFQSFSYYVIPVEK